MAKIKRQGDVSIFFSLCLAMAIVGASTMITWGFFELIGWRFWK